MRARSALVTLAIGRHFATSFGDEMMPKWRTYCARHGLGLEVITDLPDDSPRAAARSPAWQKLIVHRNEALQKYERLAWVDADIVIREDAPNIFEQTEIEFVGAVDDFATPGKHEHRAMLERLYGQWDRAGIRYFRNLEPREYYAHFGIACDFKEVVQTGVLVYSPQRHGSLFEHIYQTYDAARDDALNHEMRPASYELLKAGVVQWMTPQFNMQWSYYRECYYRFLNERLPVPAWLPKRVTTDLERMRTRWCVQMAYENNAFLHFSGGSRDYLLL